MNAPVAAELDSGAGGYVPDPVPASRVGGANLVCCVCTGRHHPLNCLVAARVLDQCADPTPDDYTGPSPATSTSRLTLVADLPSRPRRSHLDPVVS